MLIGLLIEPEWNVNNFRSQLSYYLLILLIEPEWNVNAEGQAIEVAALNSFNRTRMECKFFSPPLF